MSLENTIQEYFQTQQKEMLLDWTRKIHQLEFAHTFQSKYDSMLGSILRFIAFITALVLIYSVVLFKEFYDMEYVPTISLFILLLCLFSAVIQSKHAYLHAELANRYEVTRHKIEYILYSSNEEGTGIRINSVREEWGNIRTVLVKTSYFNKAKKVVKTKIEEKEYPYNL